MAAADNEDFDFAILDINLAGKQSSPVAYRLTERGIPFMLPADTRVTGLVEPCLDAPTVLHLGARSRLKHALFVASKTGCRLLHAGAHNAKPEIYPRQI
ncbi:hypothetical protein LJR257_006052 [Ensifer adhaerens]